MNRLDWTRGLEQAWADFMTFVPKVLLALVILVVGYIIATGIFAALSQISIAPAIVNGLYYALLPIIAGSAIVAIGGGGILPMRSVWENAIDQAKRQSAQLRARSTTPAGSTVPRTTTRRGDGDVAASAKS